MCHSGAETSSKIQELNREIEIRENSTKKVESKLKASSLRKEKQQRTGRIAKLCKELIIAEKQLEKSEEEGELQSRKANTSKLSINLRFFVYQINLRITVAKLRSQMRLFSDLLAMNRLNVDVDRDLAILGLLSDSSSSNSEQDSDIDIRGAVTWPSLRKRH